LQTNGATLSAWRIKNKLISKYKKNELNKKRNKTTIYNFSNLDFISNHKNKKRHFLPHQNFIPSKYIGCKYTNTVGVTAVTAATRFEILTHMII
jgi:SET domain-containing protein